MLQSVEVSIITVSFLPRCYTQRMMKLINPLRIHAVAMLLKRVNKLVIVEVKFNNEMVPSTCCCHKLVYLQLHLSQNVCGAEVFDGMHCIEAQCINVKVAEPHECVLYEVLTYAITPFIIEVDGVAPWRSVFVCEEG